MKKRVRLLFFLLIVIMIAAAIIYAAGRLGWIGETVMMLLLLPLMLGAAGLTCAIYVEGASDEKRDR